MLHTTARRLGRIMWSLCGAAALVPPMVALALATRTEGASAGQGPFRFSPLYLFLLVHILVLLLLPAGLWIALQRLLLRPLGLLADYISTLVSGAAFALPPGLAGSELAYLGNQVRQMARSLHDTIEKLENESLSDALTGLANHRWLDREGERLWQVARRAGAPFSIIALDLDWFKEVNDRHGHLMGDRVLVQVGRLIAAQVRETDIAVRLGGDEFAIVLPETVMEGAVVTARRILEALSAAPLTGGAAESIPINASIGVACSTLGGFARLEDLLWAADQALYAAKTFGGARVQRWTAGPMPEAPEGPQQAAELALQDRYLPGPAHRDFHRALSRLLLLSDPDAGVHELLRACVRISGARQGAIFLFEPQENTLRYRTSVGVAADLDERLRARRPWRYGDERGVVGWVASTRKPLYIPDLLQDPRWTGRSSERRSALWVPLVIGDDLYGVFNVLSSHVDGLSPEARRFVCTMSEYGALILERHRHQRQLEASLKEIQDTWEASIQVIGRALELRDYETQGHTERVARWAMQMAERIDADPAFVRAVRWGSLLHDVGKLAIPDSILLKPHPLTEAERHRMNEHRTDGRRLLAGMTFLPQATLDVVRHHHEQWAGTGFPDGLAQEKIPLTARLFAVVDVYDALVSQRPYKPSWSHAEAKAYLREQAGRQFDPFMVELFLDIVGQEEQAAG